MLVEPSFTSLQLFVACCCAVVCTYRPCFIANTLSAAIACNAPEHLQIKCSLADYTLIHQAKPIPIWTVISYSAAPGYFVPAHIYIGSRKLKTNPCCHSGHTSNNKKKKKYKSVDFNVHATYTLPPIIASRGRPIEIAAALECVRWQCTWTYNGTLSSIEMAKGGGTAVGSSKAFE